MRLVCTRFFQPVIIRFCRSITIIWKVQFFRCLATSLFGPLCRRNCRQALKKQKQLRDNRRHIASPYKLWWKKGETSLHELWWNKGNAEPYEILWLRETVTTWSMMTKAQGVILCNTIKQGKGCKKYNKTIWGLLGKSARQGRPIIIRNAMAQKEGGMVQMMKNVTPYQVHNLADTAWIDTKRRWHHWHRPVIYATAVFEGTHEVTFSFSGVQNIP